MTLDKNAAALVKGVAVLSLLLPTAASIEAATAVPTPAVIEIDIPPVSPASSATATIEFVRDDVLRAAIELRYATPGTLGNGIELDVAEAAGVGAWPTLVGDEANGFVVAVDGTVSTSHAGIAQSIALLPTIEATLTEFEGDGLYVGSIDTDPPLVTLLGGVDASNGLAQDASLRLTGSDAGSVEFSFAAGTSIEQLKNALNAATPSTGVSASAVGSTLRLASIATGSDAFVQLDVLSEAGALGEAMTFTDAINGTSVVAFGADAVPEPTPAAAFALGLLAVQLRRRARIAS